MSLNMDAHHRRLAFAVLVVLVLAVPTSGCLDRIFGGDDDAPDRSSWAFDMIKITNMNEDGYRGEGIIVGIVDTGINTGNDLASFTVIDWLDLIEDKDEPYDDHGHGTHVAGIISGKGDLRGGAPLARLIVVKALNSEGTGTDANVAEGIDHCNDNGAHVICLSLGGRARFLNLGSQTTDACNRAIDDGVIVVAAAGNDGENDDDDVSTPADVEDVIAVGAVDRDRKIAPFSSAGDNEGPIDYPLIEPDPGDRVDPDKKPEVVAPGVGIVSAYKGDNAAKVSGTSQATAFMAACAALAVEAEPDYQRSDRDGVDRFKDALMESASKNPGQNTPHDDHYGYGLVDTVSLVSKL